MSSSRFASAVFELISCRMSVLFYITTFKNIVYVNNIYHNRLLKRSVLLYLFR